MNQKLKVKQGAVSVTTMHRAKGLEFRAVAAIAFDDEVIPLQERIEHVSDDSDLEEVYHTEQHLGALLSCDQAHDNKALERRRLEKPTARGLNGLQGGQRAGTRHPTSQTGDGILARSPDVTQVSVEAAFVAPQVVDVVETGLSYRRERRVCPGQSVQRRRGRGAEPAVGGRFAGGRGRIQSWPRHWRGTRRETTANEPTSAGGVGVLDVGDGDRGGDVSSAPRQDRRHPLRLIATRSARFAE